MANRSIFYTAALVNILWIFQTTAFAQIPGFDAQAVDSKIAIRVFDYGNLAQKSRVGLSFAKDRSGKAPSVVTIGISNSAVAPTSVLELAKKVAGEVLEGAGVAPSWVSCPGPNEGMSRYPDCPMRLGPSRMLIKLGSPFKRKDGFRESHLGFATEFQATIVYEQVAQTAMDADIQPGLALGMIMAHEIGHILLGENSHSANGIMRALWRPKDFVQGSAASHQFTAAQIERIRTLLFRDLLGLP